MTGPGGIVVDLARLELIVQGRVQFQVQVKEMLELFRDKEIPRVQERQAPTYLYPRVWPSRDSFLMV
jgi:hypothetical protein